MHAYIVNLDGAHQRWALMEQSLAGSPLTLHRVPGVDGSKLTLPYDGFDAERFRRRHGRTINPREIGCYLSHVKAMATFLESGESHAAICEDDLVLLPGFNRVLERAMEYRRYWNILRLTGLSTGHARPVVALDEKHHLCVNFGRMKGAGMYLVDRKAAEAFTRHLVPMWLPYDHAFDREWWFGLKAASVIPFPVSQVDSGLRSSIQNQSGKKLSRLSRYATTYPYQVCNELSRWTVRTAHYLAIKREEARQGRPESVA